MISKIKKIPFLFHLICFITCSVLTLETCYGRNIPQIYTARGIIFHDGYRAQENTLDAILAVKQWNLDHPESPLGGCEVNVIVTHPKNGAEPAFVCSHDDDLQDLTGQKINIRGLSREQIEKLQIKQVLNGIDYGKTRNFAFLEQVFAETMKDGAPPFTLWLGIKDKPYNPISGPSYTAIELIKALEKWRAYYLKERNIDIFQYIIISSTNPFIVNALDKESKKRGLEKSLQIFPDYSDYSLPKFTWEIFLDKNGGFERLFQLTSNWVAFEQPMLTAKRIEMYHNQHKKIIGWGTGTNAPFFNDLDVALLSY